MMKENNLDELFREKLRNYELNPPAGLLENVQTGVAVVRKRRKLLYWRTMAVAASLLLAFFAGWQFNTRNERIPKQELAVQVIVPEKAIENAPLTEKIPASQPAVYPISKKDEQIAINLVAAGKISKAENSGTQSVSVLSTSLLATASESDLLKPLKSLFHLLAQDKIENELQERKAMEERVERMEKTIDQQIMENNRKQFLAENSLREKGRWLIGAQVSPAFSIDRSSHSQVYATNMINSKASNPVDFAGGISIEYKTGKRLSFQSGIYYSGIGQTSGNSTGSGAYDNLYASAGAGYLSTPVNINVAANKVMMNSSAGVIELNGVPTSIIMGANIEDKSQVTNAVMLSDAQFVQNFEYLEIPVYLRYNLIDARIGLELLGGFSSNFLIGNDTYLQNNTGKSLVGSTQNMQTLNYSGTLGFGLKYSLSKHIFLNVEPQVKYFLNSLNTNSAVNYKPYTIGIYTGISYEF